MMALVHTKNRKSDLLMDCFSTHRKQLRCCVVKESDHTGGFRRTYGEGTFLLGRTANQETGNNLAPDNAFGSLTVPSPAYPFLYQPNGQIEVLIVKQKPYHFCSLCSFVVDRRIPTEFHRPGAAKDSLRPARP